MEYTFSANFYTMIQVFILTLLIFVMVLLIILLGIYINTVVRSRHKDALTRKIEAVTKKAVAAKSLTEAFNILRAEELFNRRGLAILNEVYDAMDDKSRRRLKKLLLEMDIEKNLTEQLTSDNEDYLIEIVHMANDMGLAEMDGEITQVLRAHAENACLQYEAFLALACFGSHDKLASICKDESFPLALSFRSLQEVIDSYAGDKPELYKELLGSPDAYITRICIKCIGNEGIIDLAPEVEAFLESDNINIVIDAIRALGMLAYKPAVTYIATFLKHERWEVRSAAVSALASLNVKAHIDELITAMQDSEWQVRFNAGYALSALKDDGSIRKKIDATGDRFTIDMMDFMTDLVKIGGAAK